MYHYANYREGDIDRLVPVIRAYPLGLIASCDDSGFVASHIPFMIEQCATGEWQLRGHMHAANPQVDKLNNSIAYVVFPGPNTYISPSVYVSRQLPTWNYIAVHVSGFCLVDAPNLEILDDIERLSLQSEPPAGGWVLDKTDERVRGLAPLIRRLIVKINTIEGRFKLSQEKSGADRLAATRHLIAQNPPWARTLLESLCMGRDIADDQS